MENFKKVEKLTRGTEIIGGCAFLVDRTKPIIDTFKVFVKASLTTFVTCECLICGRPIGDVIRDDGLRICESCWEEIDREPSPTPYRIKNLEVYFYGLYEGRLRDLVLAYKFGKHPRLSRSLASFLMKTAHKHALDFDFVTFVPTTRTSKRNRGFDHMALIAREFSRLAGREVFKLLKTARETDQLLAADRREAVRGKFVLQERITEKLLTVVDSKTVLLLDDVLTTGNTVDECLKVLKKSFPRTRFLPLVVAIKR